MTKAFIRAENGRFVHNGRPLRLRGFGLGSWLNLEHFMIRIPGVEKRIREVFEHVYGRRRATAFFETFVEGFITEPDFRFLKQLGVNVVRLAINHHHFEGDQSPGVYDDRGFAPIDRVLELCRRHGMFAILDMHTAPGGQNADVHSDNETGVALFWRYAALRDQSIALWRHIAARYRDEPVIAGYDILNEPCFVHDADVFNDFFERAIAAIREVDGNHIVFLEGDRWARDFSLFRRLGGEQQALSFHLYPGQFVNPRQPPDVRRRTLDTIIRGYDALRAQTGMPLWCGETGGVFPGKRHEAVMDMIEQCLDLLEQYEVSWTLWAYKDARAMSLVYPREETPWMAMGRVFKPHWQTGPRRSGRVAADVLAMLAERFDYPFEGGDENEWSFRVEALLYEMHLQYTVQPWLEQTPWERIKDYPESFRWENCDYRKPLAELVTRYTGAQAGL